MFKTIASTLPDAAAVTEQLVAIMARSSCGRWSS